MTQPVDLRKWLAQQWRAWAQAGLSEAPRSRAPWPWPPHNWTPADAATKSATATLQAESPPQGASAILPAHKQSSSAAPQSAELPDPASRHQANPPKVPAVVPSPSQSNSGPSSAPISSAVSVNWAPSAAGADRGNILAALAQEVAACTRCAVLAKCRKQTVFGSGNPHARLCFLGEAPGADEDQQGLPFVGESGQLLTKIIEACQLQRGEVYILNTIKCRPPGNRNPTEEELANCWDFARQQLAVIQPEFICCLGRVAAQALLRTSDSIARLRGRFHAYGTSQVLVTYHPSYLLRTPSAKRQTWEDMQLLMRAMGISIPPK